MSAGQTALQLNFLERAIAAVAPVTALNRAIARRNLRVFAGAHEATRPGRLRKSVRDWGSGQYIAGLDHRSLRDQARHLERDHDIARGALNTLVQNVIATGIGVEPMPRMPGERVDVPLATQLTDLWADWCERPEVTQQHDFARAQQLLARSWLRDGEALLQDLIGFVPHLDHGTEVPYSIEMIESDLLPIDYEHRERNIVQGIELNAWGKAVGYWIYKRHPADVFAPWSLAQELKRVSAEFMHHLALTDRIGQLRGISVFASALTRLEDIKDYEESERIAAKIAASMTAFVKRGDPTAWTEATSALMVPNDPGTAIGGSGLPQRALRMQPGMIIDDLLPGEDIGMIDSNRPNPNAETWRNGQLRAASAALGVSFSSLAKNYNGTYSAQRQELVEQYGAYAMLSEAFVAQCVRPIYRQFVSAAVLSGKIKPPHNMTLRHLAAAMFVRPAMPWIDPLREAKAFELLEEHAWMSGPEIIRRRGASPREVLESETAWRGDLAAAGIHVEHFENQPAQAVEDLPA